MGLPPTLEETSARVFVADEGPIRKLVWKQESYSATELELWLQHAHHELADMEEAKVGPIAVFENPSFVVRGFEASFGMQPQRRATRAVLTLARASSPLTVQTKCRPGYEEELRALLRSVKPRAPGLAHGYPIYDLEFESHLPLRPPASFVFSSRDDAMRVWVFRSPRAPEPSSPDWRQHFGLGPEVTLTVIAQPPRTWLGRTDTTSEAVPVVIHERSFLATSDQLGQLRQLVYADARLSAGSEFFHFMMAAEGDATSVLETWSSLLGSAHRE